MNATSAQVSPAAAPRVEIRPLLRNVYLWMTLGLFITAGSAYVTVSSKALLNLLYSPFVVWGVFLLQLILVASLAAAVMRLSTGAAAAIFLVYAALNGFTLSMLLLYYDLGTVVSAFTTTAILFLVMSVVGTVTHMDMTKMGTYLLMALLGLIIAMFLNMFMQSAEFDLVISLLGVIIFTALTAADTQKIVHMASDPSLQEGNLMGKLSILGALTLYLDFLNLFIFLVRIFGRQ